MRQNKIFDVIQNMKKAASADAAFWCIRILYVLVWLFAYAYASAASSAAFLSASLISRTC